MIIPVKGKVKFPITLDIGTWLFDDHKIDLDTYFEQDHSETNTDEEYLKKTGQFFDREIKEGAITQPPPKPNTHSKRQHMKTGSFGIKIDRFIRNAEPLDDAKDIVFETVNGDIRFPLTKLAELILAFSHKGKPLKDDGPLHILFDDGSNRENPIKFVSGLRIE
ncbi:peptidyl-prolyl cis-trans isomerase [Bacillus ginsengihumi]|uniref:Peptidyl-prolyl cis-trans isomerase n=2 Tax=Heyndrickxia ginsengihumi TaxID=363870 RepID=A0A0A6V8D0_9BACI|nr:hypothetical protein [Heyndrickxia ginsengihumi]KHD84300.1 hypothetical protein NG54_16475 [Heyndrickxia ginsengihumi]MBE6183663.1 peptidyl-prolyl cis-trans isomerase [Bacillus sp. (in: firmicutes)]MCM3022373.1 peptidyl-prolyl cis-trans isomerase [Heyndrickxia ginsengihumi]NEY18685.1 peptidyl-prolyl cis-trans isomerase [Heyndrickxia ginsengihumi]